jgi:prephenate dehydrogenase
MARIAIVGLGLIGGSIALALKRAKLKDLETVGFDLEYGLGSRAKRSGVIDVEARSLAAVGENAGMIIIATPISEVRRVFEEIAPNLAEGAVVTDTCSTKRDVLAWAKELLPEHVSFVGGHPMAGKESSGLDAADATLFQGRPWAIVPSVTATERAVNAIENLVSVLGAKPVIIDAEEHDTYVAAISHLPLVAASALFSLMRESQAWEDLGVLAGPGFRDTTRLASTNPALSHDITLTNRENVLHWLDRYIEELRRYRGLMADEDQQDLYKTLLKTQSDRDAFLERPPERERPSNTAEIGSSSERMMSFLFGDFVMRRSKDIEKMLEARERDDPLKRGGR